jgi:hypothetical protein
MIKSLMSALAVVALASPAAFAAEKKIFECSSRFETVQLIQDAESDRIYIRQESRGGKEVLNSSTSEGEPSTGSNVYYVTGSSTNERLVSFNEAQIAVYHDSAMITVANQKHSGFKISKDGEGSDCSFTYSSDNQDLLKTVSDYLNAGSLE